MRDRATGKKYTAMSLTRERQYKNLNILSMNGRIYVKDGGLDSDKNQIKGGILWEDNNGRSNYGIGPHQSGSYSSGNYCDATQVWGALYCQSLLVSGQKSRIVDTDNYGTRAMYCYESAIPSISSERGRGRSVGCGETSRILFDMRNTEPIFFVGS